MRAAGRAGKKKRFKKPSMRAGRAVDSDEAANALSLLEDIDMSCLHRSLHVQEMLGDMEVRAPAPLPHACTPHHGWACVLLRRRWCSRTWSRRCCLPPRLCPHNTFMHPPPLP